MMAPRQERAHAAHAFTLTEMLIVLAIMGLLAGVAVWSVTGVRGAAESAAADAAESGVALQCDAARGGLLFVAGCEGQTLPAALAEPQLGPIADSLQVEPAAGSTPVNGTANLTVTVSDQVDEPFEGAQVRFEMLGIGFLDGQAAGATDAAGVTTINYSRSVSGTDTITVCTNANGTLPDDCDSATGASDVVTHTWTLPRPVLVAWNRIANDTAEVVWSTPLGGMFAVSGYRIYLDEANCTADTGAATISNRTIVDEVPNGRTTVRFTISGLMLQPGLMANRRLRVLDDTETNPEGIGNNATDCVAAGTVPTAENVSIAPSNGRTQIGATATLTFTVTQPDNDGFGGAWVRYEITGSGDLAGTSPLTGSNGQTTVSYARNSDGADTITACTNVDGTAPTDCASATGPTATTTHEWSEEPPEPLDPPSIVRWNRVNNSTALVVWDRELGATFAMTNYLVYLDQDNCASDTGAATITGRVISEVAANGQTTVHVAISGFSLPQGQIDDRRLIALNNTETNLEGIGNAATNCLAPS